MIGHWLVELLGRARSPVPTRTFLNWKSWVSETGLAPSLPVDYAAPNLTDTNFDTPGSCMVTP
jgi:hypothetical protein